MAGFSFSNTVRLHLVGSAGHLVRVCGEEGGMERLLEGGFLFFEGQGRWVQISSLRLCWSVMDVGADL